MDKDRILGLRHPMRRSLNRAIGATRSHVGPTWANVHQAWNAEDGEEVQSRMDLI